jgi:hypothetical protein
VGGAERSGRSGRSRAKASCGLSRKPHTRGVRARQVAREHVSGGRLATSAAPTQLTPPGAIFARVDQASRVSPTWGAPARSSRSRAATATSHGKAITHMGNGPRGRGALFVRVVHASRVSPTGGAPTRSSPASTKRRESVPRGARQRAPRDRAPQQLPWHRGRSSPRRPGTASQRRVWPRHVCRSRFGAIAACRGRRENATSTVLAPIDFFRVAFSLTTFSAQRSRFREVHRDLARARIGGA